MKILFIEPNYDSHIIHPPLGLGYLASVLRMKGYSVSIYDGSLYNAGEEDFINVIKKFQPSLIGISLFCREYKKVKSLISKIKNNFKIPIVVGGPQASALPKYVLQDLDVNFVVLGEGEITIQKLVEELERGNSRYSSIEGLAYKQKSGTVVINKERDLITDLDSLPFPAWDLMPPEKYRIVPILSPAKKLPIAPVITSRGCPYECTFCATNITWKRKFRMRSPKNVIQEIKYLLENFGVKEIHFCDDNITLKRKYIEDLCNLILKEGIKISWQCPNGVRVDTLNKEILIKMKEAGCYSVGLGIESGNQTILNHVKKKLDLQKTRQILRDIKDVGIRLYGFFIIGLPGETEETIRDTIRFAKQNPFNRAWFCILAPYPGSEIFSDFLKEKNMTLEEVPWDKLDTNTALVGLNGLNYKSIEGFQKIAAREFYMRPKILIDIVANLGLKELMTLLKTRFIKKTISIK